MHQVHGIKWRAGPSAKMDFEQGETSFNDFTKPWRSKLRCSKSSEPNNCSDDDCAWDDEASSTSWFNNIGRDRHATASSASFDSAFWRTESSPRYFWNQRPGSEHSYYGWHDFGHTHDHSTRESNSHQDHHGRRHSSQEHVDIHHGVGQLSCLLRRSCP